MNKFMTIGTAGAMAAAVVLTAAAPASAQMGPWWWHHHHYHRYYGPGPAIGAGIVGFAAGAALAGAARDRTYASDHVAACEDAYRSYDVRTDTYLGYDGARHYCQL